MGMGSFLTGSVLGIVLGIVLTIAFILLYIINTFGVDFLPILANLLDGDVSFNDMMALGRYFGYF